MHKLEQCVLDHYLEVTGLILTRLATEGNACKKSTSKVLWILPGSSFAYCTVIK